MATTYTTRNDKKIVIDSLTFGYLEDVENNIIEDGYGSSIMDSTGLTSEEVRNLTRVEVQEIFDIVKRETYPELFNADGTEKSDIESDLDKKKKKD